MRRSPLDQLIKASIAAFNALSPEQQQQHRRDQRKSWVIGELLLEHPDMSREEAERLFDSLPEG